MDRTTKLDDGGRQHILIEGMKILAPPNTNILPGDRVMVRRIVGFLYAVKRPGGREETWQP